MPDEQAPQTQPAEGDQEGRGVLRLRQDRADTTYANLTLVTTTPEEVVVNFGVSVMPPTPNREVNAEVTDRVIMTYASAKRLAITLGNVIQRYEAAKGVIDTSHIIFFCAVSGLFICATTAALSARRWR